MSAVATRVGQGISAFLLQVLFFVLVTIATLVWGWAGFGVAAMVSFIVQFAARRAFAVSRARHHPPQRDPGQPLRWRPRVSVGGLLSGVVIGVGGAMMLQQFGLAVFDLGRLIQALAAGVLVGIAVPSVLWAITVARYNARLRRLRPVAPAAGMSAAAVLAWIAVGAAGLLGVSEGAAPSARADLSGSCEMSVDGRSLAGLGPANPVTVADREARIEYIFTKPAGITSGWGGLTYMGANIPVFSQGDDDVDPDGDGAGVETGVLAIGQLLNAGTGLYEGRLEWSFADGSSCSGSVIFDLLGDPLSTPLGAGSVALVAGGLVGLLAGAGASGAGAHATLRRATPVMVTGSTVPSGSAPPSVPSTRTVILSGADARAALDRMRESGPGAVIELPSTEQWDLTAETEGRRHREGWVGTHGSVTHVGAILEGEDGEITISVDVAPMTAAGTAPPAESVSSSDAAEPPGREPSSHDPGGPVEHLADKGSADSADARTPAEGDAEDPPPAGATPMISSEPEPAEVDPDDASAEHPPTSSPAPAAAPAAAPAGDAPAPTPTPDHTVAPRAEALAALEELRESLPHSLRPVVDHLEPLIASGAQDATIPASLLEIDGVVLRDGVVSYDLGLVEVRIAPMIGADGGLTAQAKAVVFGIEADVPADVIGVLNDGLDRVNAVLRSADVRLTGVTVDSAGIRVSGAAA